jgi:hypothetical protein
LCGPILDQADLHGLLLKIRDLGLPVLSVMPLPITVDQGSDWDCDERRRARGRSACEN